METLQVLKERRSIRKFLDKDIPEDILDKILEAGVYSASGRGLQSPILLCIKDKEIIKKLSKKNAEIMGNPSIDPFYGAPVVVVVLADNSVPTHVYDGSVVLTQLMLAAYDLGIGSCWIHRAKEEFEDEVGQSLLKELGINGDYEGIGHCILGYPDMTPVPKSINESRIYKL